MTTTYYKFLGKGGKALQGSGSWHLPRGRRPGKWMPVISNPILCRRGYHATTVKHLSCFLGGRARLLAQVELRGLIVPGHDKWVGEQGRLLKVWPVDERVLRLLACDFAEHVLPLFEAICPTDDRPRKTIEVARRYAVGEATLADLRSAFAAASSSAASASSAAYAAADASAAYAASYASAAADASAAYAASYAAERLWQGQRIIEVVTHAEGG